MTLKIIPLESLAKGTMKREALKKEIAAYKANPAGKYKYVACVDCLKDTPISEIGRRYANGSAACKACCEKVKRKRKAPRRSEHSYRRPKLPGWMFS